MSFIKQKIAFWSYKQQLLAKHSFLVLYIANSCKNQVCGASHIKILQNIVFLSFTQQNLAKHSFLVLQIAKSHKTQLFGPLYSKFLQNIDFWSLLSKILQNIAFLSFTQQILAKKSFTKVPRFNYRKTVTSRPNTPNLKPSANNKKSINEI